MGYLSRKSTSSISTSKSPLPASSKKPNHKEISKSNPHNKIHEYNYNDLSDATNGFSEKRLLGRGSHGVVYKGVLRNGRQVAIKKPLISSNNNNNNNEFDILLNLNSSTLVNLIGFSNNNDSHGRLLVFEFMRNGTLYDVLHSADSCFFSNWGRRVKLALEIAKAIDFLHSSNPHVIIHRDIKSANVLLNKNSKARLGDFGLAIKLKYDDNCKLISTPPPAGTMGYLDPNYVSSDHLSSKIDVFSFGILLLEIISGRKAIDVKYSPISILDWAIPLIRRGKLLAIFDPRIPVLKDVFVRKQLALMAAKCVRSCRDRRPTMKEVVCCLNGLTKLVPLHYSWTTGLMNPCCLMVENVGNPVELKGKKVEGRSVFRASSRMLKNSGRVHSDLGVRDNLMDLMNGNERELEFDREDDDGSVSGLA